MSYAERMRADVRLAILQILSKDQGYSHNHEVMRRAVDMATAHTLTDTEVREHFSWLEDSGLVRTEHLDQGLVKATLTNKGLKVAEGAERIDGVARPKPAL